MHPVSVTRNPWVGRPGSAKRYRSSFMICRPALVVLHTRRKARNPSPTRGSPADEWQGRIRADGLRRPRIRGEGKFTPGDAPLSPRRGVRERGNGEPDPAAWFCRESNPMWADALPSQGGLVLPRIERPPCHPSEAERQERTSTHRPHDHSVSRLSPRGGGKTGEKGMTSSTFDLAGSFDYPHGGV